MFLGFLASVAVIVGLTLLGAHIARRSPGNHPDDPPIIGPGDF